MEPSREAAAAAETVCEGFLDYHDRFRDLTRRARRHFERRDWAAIRKGTMERLNLHPRAIGETFDSLRPELGGRLADLRLWTEMKAVYTRQILGRDDFELAQTFFNSLARRVFPHVGVDAALDYTSDDFPLPYKGWEMASARAYAVHRVDAGVVSKILEDSGFGVRFRDLDGDSEAAAARVEQGIVETLGAPEIEAVDVLRPVFIRNKGAYIVARARRGAATLPLVLVVLNEPDGLVIDAVLHTEDEASVVFSFARWYFHADVASPRELIGFLHSIMPRKRLAELYIALGYNKHGKTEFFRDLMGYINGSDEQFVVARGQPGLVMSVFTLPSYEFVFKVIKDHFPPQKRITRRDVLDKYRLVLLHDRVGRLVDFQEFEHLTFPRERFSGPLLDELLEVASHTVEERGGEVVIRHLYVGRRVTPLDVFLKEASAEAAEVAVIDWGDAMKDLAAADIFPGDMLLKNFGVTRHGRVVFYDYDELCPLTECNFRRFPQARSDYEELAPEPWFSVGEADVFPEELSRFLGLGGRLREVFSREHADLFDVDFWRGMQERNRRGEIIDFYPYVEKRRLQRQVGAGAG